MHERTTQYFILLCILLLSSSKVYNIIRRTHETQVTKRNINFGPQTILRGRQREKS